MALITSSAVDFNVSSDMLFECNSNFFDTSFLGAPFSFACFFSLSSALRSGRESLLVEERAVGCLDDVAIDSNFSVDENVLECREFK
jgi:hypothetical protein